MRVVLPLMICRFSNTDREVRFLGQYWISRNPGGHTKINNLDYRTGTPETFELPVISFTVLKYSSFSGSMGGML